MRSRPSSTARRLIRGSIDSWRRTWESAAIALAGRDDALLLAAATDGVDGVTRDAGGLVDGGSCERGAIEGLDARDCLLRADSGRFLAATGDLVCTGPTLTNVGDLVLGLRATGGA